MKIKKVADKNMVIHTKEKMKIHQFHKNSNTQKDTLHSNRDAPSQRKADTKFRYLRKKSKQNKKDNKQESNLISRKNSIKQAGLLATKAFTDQLEGGKEVQKAAGIAYGTTQTITGVTSKGVALYHSKSIQERMKKIKVLRSGKQMAKCQMKKATGKLVKEPVKKVTKETVKQTAKTGAKVAGTAAGTATTGVGGILVGKAAGKVVGEKLDRMDVKTSNRSRKIKFFLDKMKAEDKQGDSLGKLVKDLISNKAMLLIKKAVTSILAAVLGSFLLIAIACLPVVAVVTVLYNSPFAIFLPSLEEGDTVITVAKGYETAFQSEVRKLATEHTNCDSGDIVYVDYEGESGTPSNLYDVVAVYMVKYGVGDTATTVNDTTKSRLRTVFDAMCSYTTEEETKTKDKEEGTADTEKTLHVKVTLKSYRDMISIYDFSEDEVEMLQEIMSSTNFTSQDNSNNSNSDGTSSMSALSASEIEEIVQDISDASIKTTLTFALLKVGYPYSQDYRDSGEYFDCSSLAFYSWKEGGKDICFHGATTAAAEGQGLYDANKTVSFSDLKPGDLIFYSYCQNGRFKNISHVAIYVGNGKVVEAANERIGVVYREVQNQGRIVMIGRP